MTESTNRSLIIPIVVTVVLVAGVVLAVFLTPAPAPPPGATDPTEEPQMAQVGSLAPEFTVTTLDGSGWRLSAMRGKRVLINFWGTWCAPCEKEMPDLDSVYRSMSDEIAVIGLAVNDSPSQVRSFAERKSITFPLALDEGRVAGNYLVSGFPTTVLVDENGVIAARVARAFPDAESIRRLLREAATT